MPAAVQTSLRTLNKASVHREIGTEIVGYVTIADKPKKIVVQIAPQLLEGTRLKALGAVYQKYRFKNLKFRLAPGIATNVSGQYTAGFSTDPEWNPNELNEIFAVPGARNTTVWSPMEIVCDVTHSRQPWYETSLGEAYDTIQGTFAILSSTAVNLNGEVTVPLVMDYNIEFQDTRLPKTVGGKYEVSGATLLVPNQNDANNGLRTVVPGSAVISPAQPLPTGGEIYHLAPAIEVKNDVQGEFTEANYMKWKYSGNTWQWIFYSEYEFAVADAPIKIEFPGNVEQTLPGNFFIYPVF